MTEYAPTVTVGWFTNDRVTVECNHKGCWLSGDFDSPDAADAALHAALDALHAGPKDPQ